MDEAAYDAFVKSLRRREAGALDALSPLTDADRREHAGA